MKILLIMDPGIPVPPTGYGGHERLVYLFAEEYKRLGHEVSLLAGPDSYCSGTTYTFGLNDLKRSSYQKNKEILFAWRFLYKHHKNFDLIHNFGRLIYLLPVLNYSVKKIITYGRIVSPRGIKIINVFPNKNLIFTACSDYCVSSGNVAGKWETVYNAIDFSKYSLVRNVSEDAPLIFLGRLDIIKGPDIAIRVALRTNNRLIIAGNLPSTPDNIDYYEKQVKPFLRNEKITYVGEVNDDQKNELLGKAKALLFPISGAEAFGLVMAEALACGTPVIGFKWASVPEVIENNMTGFIVNNEQEMIEAVNHISEINRSICRQRSENRFDVRIIAKQYLNLFNK